MFDFDVQSCSPMITAVVTPYQGSTVASLEVVFDSDNAQFLEALATAGYSNNTVALWPERTIFRVLSVSTARKKPGLSVSPVASGRP